MKHVVENETSGEIIAIFLTKDLADHFVKFLPFAVKVRPIDSYDFCYDEIRKFMK